MPKRKNRIRKPGGFEKHMLIKLGLGAVVLAGALGVGAYVRHNWEAAAHGAEEFIAKTVGAKVEHIMVEGLVYTDPVQLKKALKLNKGDSLVGFDSASIREQVEELSWVRLASVERKLPSTVKVRIYEYMPLARLQDTEGLWVINKNGENIGLSDERFEVLPLIKGEGAATAAAEFFALIQEQPEMAHVFNWAEFVGSRRWDVGFKSGVTVQLPEQNPARALSVLSRLDEKRKVLSMEDGVVDLRLQDRITIRLPEGKQL